MSQPLFHPCGRELHSDRPDVWYVLPDGSNLDECIEDTRQQLLSDALAYFDMVHRSEGALEALLSPYRERLIQGEVVGSPTYQLRIGFVLLRLGRTQEAREHLDIVLRSGSYEQLRPSIIRAVEENP